MDTSRRVFRGKAGPTDRRLPKYNARRRKAPRQKSEQVGAVTNDIAGGVSPEISDGDADEDNDDVIETVVIQEPPKPVPLPEVAIHEEQLMESGEAKENPPSKEDDATRIKRQKEMKHLLQRIRHVRESMSLSKAISDSHTYEQNVLNAAANCVNEWRSIVTHYSDEVLLVDEATATKAMSVQIFELIQQALQCGPLAGSKPGYFKRCGASVARMVLQFLEAAVPNRDIAQRFRFTSKQADAIDKWKLNAQKASERA